MKTIRHILKEKGAEVWSVGPNTTVFEALELMAVRDIGALAVIDGDRLVGIFSERDYARKVILKDKNSKALRVSEIMTPKVIVIGPQQTVAESMALMTRNHIRHLPVVEGSRVVGMISIGDVVKSIIAEQADAIGRLEGYVMGGELE